jgi:tRNA threonylcarbamoyladenosine biosynthesis protein TsaE
MSRAPIRARPTSAARAGARAPARARRQPAVAAAARALTVTTRSAEATARLGRRLGQLLRPGHVVGLVGDLGAGKTQLSRGACQGAGVEPGDVSSPTFAIVQTYRGRLPIHHADLYRLGDLDELYATGFMDLLGGEGALLVEWADRLAGWLPPEHLIIRLAEVDGHPTWRRLALEPAGERHAELAGALTRPMGPAAKARTGARTRTGVKRAR